MNLLGTNVLFVNTETGRFPKLGQSSMELAVVNLFSTPWGYFLQQLIKNVCKILLALVMVHGGVLPLTDLSGLL